MLDKYPYNNYTFKHLHLLNNFMWKYVNFIFPFQHLLQRCRKLKDQMLFP